MAINLKETILTPSQVQALDTVTQVILPAPATGLLNVILCVTARMDFNTVGYSGGTNIGVIIGTIYNQQPFYNDQVLPSTININSPFLKSSGDQTPPVTDEAVSVIADSTPLNGNSNIVIYVAYQTIKIDV